MAANLNPSLDLSALVMIEALAAKMAADSAAGVSSFVGGSQPSGVGTVATVGRIAATYAAASSIPVNIRNNIGLGGGVPSATTETIATIENRLEAVLQAINMLPH